MSSLHSDQPSWLKNYTPAKKAGHPDWKPGMKSPNPSGRPRGIVDRRIRITQSLMGKAEAIISVVNAAALEGDVQAASLILSRVAPILKAQPVLVSFDFDENAPVTTQAQQVLKAIACGQLDPDTGKMLMECLGTLQGIRQLDEFASRLAALESSMRRQHAS